MTTNRCVITGERLNGGPKVVLLGTTRNTGTDRPRARRWFAGLNALNKRWRRQTGTDLDHIPGLSAVKRQRDGVRFKLDLDTFVRRASMQTQVPALAGICGEGVAAYMTRVAKDIRAGE